MLKFITGNKWKFSEMQELLAPVKIQQIKIDLDEIQDLDPYKIIAHKLKQAFKYHKGPFLIEDDSLYLGCFNNQLPGPLIKWFNDSVGTKGLFDITKKMGNNKAEAQAIIAFAKTSKQIKYFESSITGKIVKPKGSYGFGFDPVFEPQSSNKTLSELKSDGIFAYSPRGLAAKKLKKYLVQDAK